MKSSSAASPYPRKTPKKTPRKPSKLKPTDPVEVFCRIRPLNDHDEETCVQVVSNTTIQLNPPQNSQGFKSGHRVTAAQHSFKQVFDEDSNQKTVFNTVALDIVHGLIHGKNGLIFAYGITGSGKTHTMTGEPSDRGLLPRGLDVLFNSIGGFQTKPCVFTPDKSNGMDVKSESDAKLDYDQKEIAVLSSLRKNRGDDDVTDMVRIPDCDKFDDVDEDNGYAVFVSYVEIYKNFIYDLLEDAKQDPIRTKPPVSKQLREDNNRNMYVQGVTEVEVKSAEEAYAMFWKGQKKSRVADTQLNMQSSRSHSVFTLKLVQAPLDPDGESVLLDKDEVRISTLSMCDLAGSERTNRTKADGNRLKEAGNINKDLMNLRSCLEILRENQANCDGSQTGKMVPYRESKLTHLFKNFFDGEGKVRMLVCLNPSAKEYDESVHVMRFAEITQEIVIARPTGINSNTGLAPGRRKANQMFEETLKNVKDDVAGTTFRQELAKLGSQTAEKDRLIFERQASNMEKEKEIQKLEMFSQKNDALQKTNQQHRNKLAPKALDDFDEDLGDLNNSGSKKTVAFLKVLAIGEFPEKTFPVYEGCNTVGRYDSCDITIPLQVVSKKHACIVVHGKYHHIWAYRSRNKTRRNQMLLDALSFYELVNKIELMFADVRCQYLFVQAEDVAQKDGDSGSDTASASESIMIPVDELEQDLKDKEEQEELGEKYLEVATQDYCHKNPERNSPIVLCPETDDETDDEKEIETGSAANKTVSSSLGTEQTLRCFSQGTQLAPTMDAAIPYNTLEPDVIPETPVTPHPQTVDFEPPFKLKRSIDVKADTSRRISAGNTLAYGLPNSTRESIDASESGKTIEEAFNEGFAPEPESKLHFEDDAGQETPNNKKSDKKLQDSVPRQDEFLDDLATQLYEPMKIPESPEFLQQDASDDEPDRGGKDETFEGEISDSKITDNKIFEATGKTSVDENNHGNSLEGPMSQVQTAKVDDMTKTQAYGLGSLSPHDEDDEIITVDTIVVPKLSNVFKVSGAMNTQKLNEGVFGNVRSLDESADENEKVANEEYDDEMDIQPTQKYFNNQVKEGAKTSESSDNLFSFSNFMDLKSDSNFMSTRKVDKHVQVVDAQSSGTTKKPACGQKKSTARRGKEEEQIIEDQTKLTNTPGKVELTKGNNAIAEDADNQHDAIVVKRGRGRSKRGTTRSSRRKRDDAAGGETDVRKSKVVENSPKRKRYNTRKRKISEKYTETKVEDDGENIETEQVSDSEDNRDTFKLQLSLTDSPDTDDFIPRREPVKESKKTTQRAKKVFKKDASTKLSKKVREKKKKLENDGAVNEEKTDENDKDGQRPSQSTRTGRAGKERARRGRARKSQNSAAKLTDGKKGVAAMVLRFENLNRVEEISDSNEMGNEKIQPKNFTVKSTKAKKVRPKVAANMVEDVDKVEGRNKTTQQENSETKIEGPTTRGRARKRKSPEEMRTEVNEGQPSREATSSSHSDKCSVDHSCCVKVIFTGLLDASLVKAKKIVQSLGGKAVEDVEECTHLVTDKVRRTVKFLCALSRGVPIVDMSWLDASKKSKSFVASTKFILIDDDAQMKYDFSMERSLQLAKNAGLLSGYKIHVTPHVCPPPDEMKEIIKCAKGEIVSKMPCGDGIDVVVISCDEDKGMCEKAHIQTAYTAELLLTGILRQNLDLEQHKLTLDAIPDVNSTPPKNKRRRKR